MITKDARNFVDGIARYLQSGDKTRSTMVPKVTSLLHKVTSSARREKLATVQSVISLTTKERAQIQLFLARLLGHDVLLECRIEKRLVGGFRIQVADWVVDTTLAAQIDTMVGQLTQ